MYASSTFLVYQWVDVVRIKIDLLIKVSGRKSKQLEFEMQNSRHKNLDSFLPYFSLQIVLFSYFQSRRKKGSVRKNEKKIGKCCLT